MKYEIGTENPQILKEYWDGQYNVFSHFEYLCGIPHALFLITTMKENGKTNACFHSWSSFSGDSGGFFAIMPGLMQNNHTYENIKREKEFCVNFINPSYYDACQKTIVNNDDDDIDELIDAGLTPENSVEIKTPRIKESFISFECKLESISDLSKKGISSLVIGKVVHAAVERKHKDIEAICGENGFMYYIHAPKNLENGEGEKSAIAGLKIIKID